MALVGQRVVICGLVSRPELNGSIGLAVDFDESNGRYTVNLEATNQMMALKPAALAAAQDDSGLRASSQASESIMEASGMPNNIIYGLARGAGTLATGVGLGAAAFVAAPIVGATEGAARGGGGSGGVGGAVGGGLMGGVAGIGLGVAALAGGTIAGVVGATGNVVAGAVNTPGSVVAAVSDDADLHGAATIDLSSVALESEAAFQKRTAKLREAVEDDLERGSATQYTPRALVKDRTLYDTLGVAPDATPSALKTAYRKLAIKEHPDKGGDRARFQEISDAWQVCSHPQSAYPPHLSLGARQEPSHPHAP